MGLFDDPFLPPRSEKERKRERIRRNQTKGRAAEDQVRMELSLEGCEVYRTGHGSDFQAIKRDPFTGEVVEDKLVEVKSGDADLSPLQEETRRREDNYEVRRRDPLVWF